MSSLYITLTLVGTVIVTLFLAVYKTMKKEKIMITEEGGEPLPTSSYVFLVLNHFIQILLYLVAYHWVLPKELPENIWAFLLMVVSLVVIVQFFTTLIEAIIRVISLQVFYSVQRRQLDKQLEEEDVNG